QVLHREGVRVLVRNRAHSLELHHGNSSCAAERPVQWPLVDLIPRAARTGPQSVATAGSAMLFIRKRLPTPFAFLVQGSADPCFPRARRKHAAGGWSFVRHLLREDVVVAGGGVVLGDVVQHLIERPQVEDAAALTQSGGASGACLASEGIVES